MENINYASNELIANFYKEIVHIAKDIEEFILDFKRNAYITEFQIARTNQINSLFLTLVNLFNLLFKLILKFKNSTSNHNFKIYIDIIIRNCIKKIYEFLEEPFSYFPDASLWLLYNNEPVGVCNIKSEDIIWNSDSNKRGSIANKIIYTDIKSLLPSDFNDPERENIGRIRIYFNLVHENELDELLKTSIFSQIVEYLGAYSNKIEFPSIIKTNGLI